MSSEPYTSEPSQMSDSQAANAPQRPGMAVFDSSPNARSTTLANVEGSHTYGALNARPTEPGMYTIGVSENMGSRRTMEDAYSFVVDFAGIQGQGFFAVFDGHAGKHAAEWCGQNFHTTFLDKLVAKPKDGIPQVIAESFLAVDKELTLISEDGTTQSGCTAVTAFLRLEDENGGQSFAPPIANLVQQIPDNASQQTSSSISKKESGGRLGRLVGAAFGTGSASKKAGTEEPAPPKGGLAPAFKPPSSARRVLYTANVGDARAVLCRSGRAVRLTYDHKGSDKKEVRRIQEAGGFVLNNRVNGVLAVTRSLGDSAMKDYVVGSPFTSQTDLTDADEFIIIACDGLWDVIEDQPAVELIRNAESAQSAAETLVKHALDNFSHDNVTALVIKFNNGGRKDTLDAGRASSS